MLLRESILVKPIVEEKDISKLPEAVLHRVTYPICNIGERNANKRVYEKDVWDKVQADETLQEMMDQRRLFGHAEHPEETQSNLEKTSHCIHKMWIGESDNTVYQTLDVVNTPMGRIVDALLRADCMVGVSTRAEGDLEEAEDDEGAYSRVIPESYRYVTTDFTADPSTFGAIPLDARKSVVSSIQSEMTNDKADVDDKRFARKLLESMDCGCHADKEKKCEGCGRCKVLEENKQQDEVKSEERTITSLIEDGRLRECNKATMDGNACVLEIKEGFIGITVDGKQITLDGADVASVYPDGVIHVWAKEETLPAPVIVEPGPPQEEVEQMDAAGPLPVVDEIPPEERDVVPEKKEEVKKVDERGDEIWHVTQDDPDKWVVMHGSTYHSGPYDTEEEAETIVSKLEKQYPGGPPLQAEAKTNEGLDQLVAQIDELKAKMESEGATPEMEHQLKELEAEVSKAGGEIPEGRIPVEGGLSDKLAAGNLLRKDDEFWSIREVSNAGLSVIRIGEPGTEQLIPWDKVPEHNFVKVGEKIVEKVSVVVKEHDGGWAVSLTGGGPERILTKYTKEEKDTAINQGKQVAGESGLDFKVIGENKVEEKVSADDVKRLFTSIDPMFAKHLSGLFSSKKDIVQRGEEVGLELSAAGVEALEESEVKEDFEAFEGKAIELGDIVQIMDLEGNTTVVPEATVHSLDITESEGTVVVEITGSENEDEMQWYDEGEYQIILLTKGNESSTSTTPSDMTALKIKEATTRAECETAVETVNELSETVSNLKNEDASNQLKLKMLASKIKKESIKNQNSLEELATKLKEAERVYVEVDALRAKLEEKAKLASDAQNDIVDVQMTMSKDITDLKESVSEKEKETETLSEKHENEIKEIKEQCLQEGRKDGTSKVVNEYVACKLAELGISIGENTRALLDECVSLREVDDILEKVTDIMRRSALHSGTITEVHVETQSVDPEQSKIDVDVNSAFQGMNGG